MSSAQRKICFEELFNKFRTVAGEWLKETPEARSLFLVVDWNVGKNDFPAAEMVVLDPPTEQSVVDAMGQTLKLLENLTGLHRRMLEMTSSTLKQAEAIIRQAEQNNKPTDSV